MKLSGMLFVDKRLQSLATESNCFKTESILRTHTILLHQIFQKHILNSVIMTNLVNSVRLIGNVGRTPEIKEFASGKKKASMSLATSEKRKNEAGELVTYTDWHNLICWGKQADVVKKFVNKGSRIAVEGKLTHREYVGSDGQKRYITEILVNEVSFMDGRKDEKSNSKIATAEENNLPF